MKQAGVVHIKATLSFTGSVDLILDEDMNISQVIHDIIHCGDYEYEVIRGDMNIEDVEPIDDWEDYYERE